MAEELEKKGNAAFVDEDFEEAVNLYTKALALDSTNASVYISRAAAHVKLENFTDAVADANKAIELNPSLPKAYLRKGIACFSLEEYQTAKSAFVAGAALEPKNPSFKTWISKCDAELSGQVPERNRDFGKETETMVDYVGVEEVNAAIKESQKDLHPDEAEVSTPMDDVVPVEVVEEELPVAPEPSITEPVEDVAPAPPPVAPPKFKHEWYETSSQVVVGVYAKGIKAEDLKVEFGEQFLSVVINLGEEDPFALQLRLFGRVIPAQCRYTLLKTKVEIKLVKAESIQWKQLEFQGIPQAVVQTVAVRNVTTGIKAKYPTSSKKPAKDWDKLEAEVKKEEKDEKLEGDAALNKLFREIYGNADEDTRRAMNKSFVESNGTVLSTNWKEVGTKKIEGSAPSGMEMKKWEL
ncbi:hypothetical protein BDL97_04G109500 [Sphagnum fallax]|nr:hypothetical protein BDL97_04G109500 [Sphagnum fallax]